MKTETTLKLQTKFNSFVQMLDSLPNEESCRKFLENLLWSGVPVCPHCSTKSKDHQESLQIVIDLLYLYPTQTKG